jgi:hypothetical protein
VEKLEQDELGGAPESGRRGRRKVRKRSPATAQRPSYLVGPNSLPLATKTVLPQHAMVSFAGRRRGRTIAQIAKIARLQTELMTKTQRLLPCFQALPDVSGAILSATE